MIEMKKIEVHELQNLGNYFLQNRNDIGRVIADFGEIENNNRYGTLFLKPLNSLFKVFWIYCRDNKVESVGFGGEHLGLSLKDLCSVYRYHTEGYSRYDEEYVYIFYLEENYKYTVKITSADRLFENENMIKNVPINGIEIRLV